MRKLSFWFAVVALAFVFSSPSTGHAQTTTQYNLTPAQQSSLVQTLQYLSVVLDNFGQKIRSMQASGEMNEAKRVAISNALSTMNQTLGVLGKSVGADSNISPVVSYLPADDGVSYEKVYEDVAKMSETNPAQEDPLETAPGITAEVKAEEEVKQVGQVSATTRSNRFLWWSFLLLLGATAVALFYSWRPESETVRQEVVKNVETPKETISQT